MIIKAIKLRKINKHYAHIQLLMYLREEETNFVFHELFTNNCTITPLNIRSYSQSVIFAIILQLCLQLFNPFC